MKILIIGGNRFVGKRVVQKLLELKHDVILFNRGSSQISGVKQIQGNRQSLGDLQKITDTFFDVIFDFACFDGDEARLAVDFFTGKTGHYIYISSQSVYGPGGYLHESDFNPYTVSMDPIIKSKDNYGQAKQQAEGAFYAQNALTVTSVRFPIILGPDDYTDRLNWHVKKIKNKEPISFPSLTARLALIHADDACEALLFLMKHKLHGPINVSAPEPFPIGEMVRLIEKKYQIKHIPSNNEDEDHSPYGIKTDWAMNCEQMKDLGFVARPFQEWLPGLI